MHCQLLMIINIPGEVHPKLSRMVQGETSGCKKGKRTVINARAVCGKRSYWPRTRRGFLSTCTTGEWGRTRRLRAYLRGKGRRGKSWLICGEKGFTVASLPLTSSPLFHRLSCAVCTRVGYLGGEGSKNGENEVNSWTTLTYLVHVYILITE